MCFTRFGLDVAVCAFPFSARKVSRCQGPSSAPYLAISRPWGPWGPVGQNGKWKRVAHFRGETFGASGSPPPHKCPWHRQNCIFPFSAWAQDFSQCQGPQWPIKNRYFAMVRPMGGPGSGVRGPVGQNVKSNTVAENHPGWRGYVLSSFRHPRCSSCLLAACWTRRLHPRPQWSNTLTGLKVLRPSAR